MNDPWKPYIDAARAAGEREAWVPDYGASGAAWQRVEVTPSDPGRFEPTPYDLGISDDPGTTWAEARESRGPRFPGLRDLYRAQEEAIAAFSAAESEASDLGRFEPAPVDLGLTGEPDPPWLLFNGQPVMEGDGGRLVYDCEPESGDGCLIPVPEPEAES